MNIFCPVHGMADPACAGHLIEAIAENAALRADLERVQRDLNNGAMDYINLRNELDKKNLQLSETEKARQELWAKLVMVIDWNGTTRIPSHEAELFEPKRWELIEWKEDQKYCLRAKMKPAEAPITEKREGL